MMKNLMILIVTLGITLSSQNVLACKPYGVVGIGYKVDEPEFFTVNGVDLPATFGSKYTARFEVGCEFKVNSWLTLTSGVSHDSQWGDGAPFNSRPEYHKTEFFLDSRFYF